MKNGAKAFVIDLPKQSNHKAPQGPVSLRVFGVLRRALGKAQVGQFDVQLAEFGLGVIG